MSTEVQVEDSAPSAIFSSLLRLSSSRSNRVTSMELLSMSAKQRSRNCSTKSSKSAVARQIVSSSCKQATSVTVCSCQLSSINECFYSTSVRLFQYFEADEQSTMGTNVANVEMNWNVTKHFLMSFGSIPGSVDMSNGMT